MPHSGHSRAHDGGLPLGNAAHCLTLISSWGAIASTAFLPKE
jgi:hypothetical protein